MLRGVRRSKKMWLKDPLRQIKTIDMKPSAGRRTKAVYAVPIANETNVAPRKECRGPR